MTFGTVLNGDCSKKKYSRQTKKLPLKTQSSFVEFGHFPNVRLWGFFPQRISRKKLGENFKDLDLFQKPLKFSLQQKKLLGGNNNIYTAECFCDVYCIITEFFCGITNTNSSRFKSGIGWPVFLIGFDENIKCLFGIPARAGG